MKFSMRSDKDLIPKTNFDFTAYNLYLQRREEESRQEYIIQQILEQQKKIEKEQKMNEKLKKAINWINFAGALLSILVKVIQEVADILPDKEENKNE